MNELDLFVAALAITDPERRAAYLKHECQGDAALQARIEQLLAANADAGSFLEGSGVSRETDATTTRAPDGEPDTVDHGDPTARVGSVVGGKYKLIEAIGEGGMGSVYMAQQTEPVKRAVAVKVIKAGMDSKAILARFEAERQALAMMDHPNIAKVFDAGTTDGGRPFFVMELVKGQPITRFCDERKLTPRQRLELFVPVCQAIQHAHQKGVIHRDIKPSNVLVAMYDDKPVPKVIDFGVAKAAGQSLTDKTLMTGFGAVVGTAEYMSPEQASLNNLDIDTRSDVYSLGVLLYELLTGTTPVDKKSLGQAALLEILRIVREVEAPRPSAKLSTLDTLPSVAANRGTEPAKLSRLMKGELDWLVLKALEKDRGRRYETANALSRDVQRYLADEVVEARPPSAGYRLRKFVRRHRGQVIAAGLVFFALLAGMAGTIWGLIEARRQAGIARAETAEREQARAAEADRAEGERLAKLEAQAQKAAADQSAAAERAAHEQAQKRLTQVEKANDLLGSIFENLDPKEIARAERPLQAILVEKLDKAVAQLEGESIGDPLVVAAMQEKFGASLLGLGEPGKAIVLLEKARATRQDKLGPEHTETLADMNNLAWAYQQAGKLDLALPLLEETLKLTKAKFGPEHLNTLTSMNNLALAYEAVGKLDLAAPLYEVTLKLTKAKFGPEHPNTLTSMVNLAAAHHGAGKLDLALPLDEEVLKLMKAKLGPDHPNTLTGMNNLALGYQAVGKLDLAVPLLEETLKIRKATLGPEHPQTLISTGNLAKAYNATGKTDLALPLFEETLRLMKVKLGPDHPDTLTSMNNLARAYLAVGKFDPALPLLEETLRLMKVKLGPEHPTTLGITGNLGKAYCEANQGEKAVATLKVFVAGRRKRAKPDDPQFAGLLAQVAPDLLKCRQYAAADEMLRECLAIREKTQPDAWSTFDARSQLGGALLGQNKYAEAEPLLLAGYVGMKQREKTIPPQGSSHIPEALERLIDLYTVTGKPDEARMWRAEWARYAELVPPPRLTP
jgi:serine/threonine protein kinase